MKYLGKAYSNFAFSGIDCLNGIQKTGPKYALGTAGKKKISWTSFLIRNDFGIVDEKHEAIGRSPLFMSMV
ncbi:MAG: hypothetical protein JW902_10985 [Syntrophaceae bacterium]|nr:hypothetical protein [Syntrophaceae bacterium]